MKSIIKDLFKKCIALLFISGIATVHKINAMNNINNTVVINSKIDDPKSLLQIHYQQKEPTQISPVGMNWLISKPEIIKCSIAYQRKKKHPSTLNLSDPHSREKNLLFKVSDGGFLTIHAKENNAIMISGSCAKHFRIRKEDDEEKECIIAKAQKIEETLAYFTYPR